ncbi:Callose synthase 7, partial [Mucuna pruriens]
ILPLVGPTKLIMGMSIDNYQWHEFFLENESRNICIVIAIWVPIILVYFMDTQIWYAIYATIFGGIVGAFSHLGEVSGMIIHIEIFILNLCNFPLLLCDFLFIPTN